MRSLHSYRLTWTDRIWRSNQSRGGDGF